MLSCEMPEEFAFFEKENIEGILDSLIHMVEYCNLPLDLSTWIRWRDVYGRIWFIFRMLKEELIEVNNVFLIPLKDIIEI